MPETKRRYIVELTTDGWQIKDSETGQFKADMFANGWAAREEAAELNYRLKREREKKLDAAEGQGRCP